MNLDCIFIIFQNPRLIHTTPWVASVNLSSLCWSFTYLSHLQLRCRRSICYICKVKDGNYVVLGWACGRMFWLSQIQKTPFNHPRLTTNCCQCSFTYIERSIPKTCCTQISCANDFDSATSVRPFRMSCVTHYLENYVQCQYSVICFWHDRF